MVDVVGCSVVEDVICCSGVGCSVVVVEINCSEGGIIDCCSDVIVVVSFSLIFMVDCSVVKIFIGFSDVGEVG